MTLALQYPTIFPSHIRAGMTLRNSDLFPPHGLSLRAAKILTQDEAGQHLDFFAQNIGFLSENIFSLTQVHGDDIALVQHHQCTLQTGDALMTNESGAVLMVVVSDCAGVLMYDPKHEAIAAVHSGWRGSQLHIVQKTIQAMQKHFGTTPGDLLVFISPHARHEHYEVGLEFRAFFPETVYERGGKYFFDNTKELTSQLLATGVPRDSIEIAPQCTIENLQYHSHRRDGDKAGRMGVFIALG